jgi:hypothetical protein
MNKDLLESKIKSDTELEPAFSWNLSNEAYELLKKKGCFETLQEHDKHCKLCQLCTRLNKKLELKKK